MPGGQISGCHPHDHDHDEDDDDVDDDDDLLCLQEMRPPTRIWQCVSGHPVCDTCIRSPRVKECPTCRQKEGSINYFLKLDTIYFIVLLKHFIDPVPQIVGRNVLAEKLAKSLYGN